MALYVTSVDENSPARKLGIGEAVLCLPLTGIPLATHWIISSIPRRHSFLWKSVSRNSIRYCRSEKGEYEPFGCNFKTYLGDEKHSCANHCMFCFIDQLPPGMREPLYLKMMTSDFLSCLATILP